MKKVILGASFIIGGILIITSYLQIRGISSEMFWIGFIIFILGCILGFQGLREND